ncbi:MAG: AAA family ATPase, partial [Dehalococcoidia bacterium]
REFVGDVIRETADTGDCVIVGHGAQRVLRERQDTLRVMVTASSATRIARVKVNMATDEKTAAKTIERTDADRADYFRRFYGIDWLEAANYDIAISTDSLSVENAVEIIELAARLR